MAVSPRGIGLWTMLATLFADQANKLWLIFVYGIEVRQPLRVTSFFDIVFAKNPGISYSLLRAQTEAERLGLSQQQQPFQDLGYVQQAREEMEVLFTFLAERYEKKSVIITSNLVFSQWDQIFKDPMTTMAAIDRLVHHATILEFNGESQRAQTAKAKSKS